MDDCKTEVKESQEQSNELELAKAFTIGVAFGFAKKYDEMDVIMEEIKAFAPQPKMGKWIMHRGYNADGFGIEYSCSECKEWEDEKSKYCPNCGAKMENNGERWRLER